MGLFGRKKRSDPSQENWVSFQARYRQIETKSEMDLQRIESFKLTADNSFQELVEVLKKLKTPLSDFYGQAVINANRLVELEKELHMSALKVHNLDTTSVTRNLLKGIRKDISITRENVILLKKSYLESLKPHRVAVSFVKATMRDMTKSLKQLMSFLKAYLKIRKYELERCDELQDMANRLVESARKGRGGGSTYTPFNLDRPAPAGSPYNGLFK